MQSIGYVALNEVPPTAGTRRIYMEDEDQTVLALVWKTRERPTALGVRFLLLPPNLVN